MLSFCISIIIFAHKIISGLYGEQVILLQYLCHICELVASCRRKLSTTMEGGLLGAMALLQHLLPYLSDHTFMEYLQVRDDVYSYLYATFSFYYETDAYISVPYSVVIQIMSVTCLAGNFDPQCSISSDPPVILHQSQFSSWWCSPWSAGL